VLNDLRRRQRAELSRGAMIAAARQSTQEARG
jgi:hypothetical protein